MVTQHSIDTGTQRNLASPLARATRLIIAALILGTLGLACTIEIPNPLASTGTPFIVKGTYEVRQVFGQSNCPVWAAETGVLYHLFQGDQVSNADFDAVTTPGVTSRLRIAVRDDLAVGCKLGTTVVVETVLQIIQ